MIEYEGKPASDGTLLRFYCGGWQAVSRLYVMRSSRKKIPEEGFSSDFSYVFSALRTFKSNDHNLDIPVCLEPHMKVNDLLIK